MESEERLNEELKKIEAAISRENITAEIYNLISLLNKRVELGKEIQQLKWNRLSNEEKDQKRQADLVTTGAYFEKFPDETRNKFLYKSEYAVLIENTKNMSRDTSLKPFLFVLIEVLNSSQYINVRESICINSIINQLMAMRIEGLTDLIDSYKRLINIPFELD